MPEQSLIKSTRPRLLFVDDEQRVLNSMRIMFKRQFDLFLAPNGPAALDIVKRQDIDVIIADHRMPHMTGVEVLSKVRTLSPRTVRILLTGYADLNAIEGSINDGEVFRFLTKPCAPDLLRETISLAAKLARETPAPGPAAESHLDDAEVLEIILSSDPAENLAPAAPANIAPAARAPAAKPFDPSKTDVIERPSAAALAACAAASAVDPAADTRSRLAAGLGVIVFSADAEVLDTVQKATRGRVPVHGASNIVQVVKILTDHRPGVLITDITNDKATIQSMTARLKEHLPELVTIAVSPHRDVLDMVWLINHGQIFRFLRKPLSAGRCAISLQAALKHHRMLLKNPELVKRHEVEASEDGGIMDGVLNKLKNVRRLWASG